MCVMSETLKTPSYSQSVDVLLKKLEHLNNYIPKSNLLITDYMNNSVKVKKPQRQKQRNIYLFIISNDIQSKIYVWIKITGWNIVNK